MKVCDLTQFYSPFSGGVKRYLEEKRKYAIANGHQHLLIIPGDETSCVETENSRTYSIKSPLVSRTSRYRALLHLGAVQRLLERERPDVIESSDPYQLAWKAISSGCALRIPVVGFYHSNFPEAYLRTTSKFLGETATEIVMEMARAYVRALYNHFRATFVPSAALGQVLGQWGVENVILAELGIDTDIFRPGKDGNATRARMEIPTDRFLLLYVGRLAHEKNVKTLFGAFEILNSENSGHFHLLVVGDGPLRDQLRELSKGTKAVSWLRYISAQDELAAVYRAADLFVHPSVQETFGLVALEAQASGTPVVGIRGSYMDRIILSDQTHWAEENSPDSLAAAILESKKLDLIQIGEAASQQVAKRYSWRRVFRQMFDIYGQL
ncbi:MAG TPA: glycosyltransferase [Chthoniobacterales bacterium]|jgi:alpha-1,6-mannosyltransferase|nr:glycosyltransferase [Chthoniobacterales bacterium]